jgi:hypothetical protein
MANAKTVHAKMRTFKFMHQGIVGVVHPQPDGDDFVSWGGANFHIAAAKSALRKSIEAGRIPEKSFRKTNPKKRVAKSKAVTRPSQATKRLLARRKATLLGPTGYYANPEKKPESTPYHVQEKLGTAWHTLSKCVSAEIAKFLATHYAKHNPDNSFRVVKV